MDISTGKNIDIADRSVVVIGLGRSGLGAARLAHYVGADVFVSDPGFARQLQHNLGLLSPLGIEGELGDHSDRIYAADLWVISPGVPRDAKIVNIARQKDIPIVSEIEFASWFTQSPIIAVTGSNGKTTTVNILNAMCQSENVHGVMAGNIGIPFSQKVLEELQNPDPLRTYILEISSFQMEFIDRFKPHFAVYLNISPDHLDRHYTFEEYLNRKLDMSRNLTERDYIIYNADDPVLSKHLSSHSATTIPFSLQPHSDTIFSINQTCIHDRQHEKLIDLDRIALPGRHNLANLLAAATTAHVMGIPKEIIARACATTTSIEHRLEKVTDINGVTYFNDSKATNVDSVKVALDSFSQPIILILGGKDKGGDFTQLIPHTHNTKAVIAYGQARQKIVAALEDAVRPIPVMGLKEAVTLSQELAGPGDVVLLSPGCASFDQFDNYEERGKKFKEWVRELRVKK
ncbi:MAG: UDP-N-acetylmuramoyl-L-alanine--D-glutamate ligase [FCB group bacterium]|nr:UDP-N-acetylmuramoyl-L-alanine--D-glutamate ligase [FCB group bacterium]